MKKQDKNQTEKIKLYKIYPNKDENNIILTYSIYIRVGNQILEVEQNTRKEVKCFLFDDDFKRKDEEEVLIKRIGNYNTIQEVTK